MSQIEARMNDTPAAVDRPHFWTHVLVPTAKGLEGFLWRLAWFTLLIFLLFSFNPFR